MAPIQRSVFLKHFRKHLDPSPDATRINGQSAAVRHFCHVCDTRLGTATTISRTTYDVARIVTPLERIRVSDGRHSPYQPAPTSFRNGTLRDHEPMVWSDTRGQLDLLRITE